MANEKFTQLPTVTSAMPGDIIAAVQGGISVQETLQQVMNLSLSNTILNFAGNPNGSVAGNTYQLLWDTTDSLLYICVTSGSATTAVWVTASSISLPVTIPNGGTGVTSVTTSPTATAFAGWDANKNLSANNFLAGLTIIATAAGTTTLTVASTYAQLFTGSTTQTVVMPVTSTLKLGQAFYISNTSSGNVTIQSSGLNTIQVMAAGTTCYLTCISLSGTGTASWNSEYAFNGGSGSGTVNTGTINDLAYYASTGTAVSALTTLASAGLVTDGGGVPGWVAYTGTGAPVLANTPSLITPLLGAASATSLKFASSTGILDANGNSNLLFVTTPSAVNYLQVTNAATGAGPSISANGSDTNILFTLSAKGNLGVGIVGTSTNSNAAASYVGEFVSSIIASGSAISLTTATAANVTSISLTAGDWDVWGNVSTAIGGAATGTAAWVSSTSATLPDFSLYAAVESNTAIAASGLCCPQQRFSLSGTTTIYLSTQSTFSTSTATACGGIYARRVR